MAEKKERDLKDIRSEVSRARRRMQQLDRIEKDIHEIETGAYNYERHIPKQLGKPVVIRGGRRTTMKALELIAAISWPLRPEVHIPRSGEKAEGINDDLEGYFANWIKKTDPRGDKMAAVRSGQVRDRAAFAWLSVTPFEKPQKRKDESDADYRDRCQRLEEEHCEVNWEMLPPDAVAPLEIDGEITFSAVELQMSVLDIVRRFGGNDSDDTAPLLVLGKKFPWLRGRDGRGAEGYGSSDDFLESTLTVYMVDDNVHIYCYVEQPGAGSTDDKYRKLEVYENCLGGNSLIPFYGIYRKNYPIKQQYEGLMWPFAELERDIIITRSLIETQSANKRWVQPPPKDGTVIRRGQPPSPTDAKSAEQGDADRSRQTRSGDVAIPAVDAELQDVSNEVDPALVKALEDMKYDWELLSAPLTLINPTPTQVEKGTAAVVLYGSQAGLRTFDPAISSCSTGVATMFRRIAYYNVHGRNPHYLKAGSNKDLDKGVRFKYLGTEETKTPHKAGEEKSIAISAFADLLDSPMSIRVEPVAETEQQRQLAMRNKAELMAMDPPMAVPEEVIAAGGNNNVSEQMGKIRAFQEEQLVAPYVATAAQMNVANRIALREERDVNAILALFAPGLGQPTAPMAPTSQGQDLNSGYQYKPPPQPTPAQSGTGAIA